MGIRITAGNHAAVFEFFGGILNAQTPSNSLAKRELARDCRPHAGLTQEIPATRGCTQSAGGTNCPRLVKWDKSRPWRTPSRILIREGASLDRKSDFAHCEIRSSRKIHVTGRFWLCRLCFFENSMRSTPAEEIFHALDSFRIGLQEARLPWFCRSSGTGWRNIDGVTVTSGRKCRRRARTGCTNCSLFMRDDGLLVS